MQLESLYKNSVHEYLSINSCVCIVNIQDVTHSLCDVTHYRERERSKYEKEREREERDSVVESQTTLD